MENYRLIKGQHDLENRIQQINIIVFCMGPVVLFLFSDLIIIMDSINVYMSEYQRIGCSIDFEKLT